MTEDKEHTAFKVNDVISMNDVHGWGERGICLVTWINESRIELCFRVESESTYPNLQHVRVRISSLRTKDPVVVARLDSPYKLNEFLDMCEVYSDLGEISDF